MRKRMKKVSAFILAAALLCSALILPEVYAAVGVDTTADCSIEIDLTATPFKHLNGKWGSEKATSTAIRDYENYPVTVNVYKVAEITVTGKYVAVDSLKDLKDSVNKKSLQELLDGLSNKPETNKWDAIMEIAKTQVEAKNLKMTASKTATASKMVIDETVDGEKLGTGLYLVDVPTVQTKYYEYNFAPGLVSLPNNYYYSTNDDTWKYVNVAVNLKPERSDRLGDLKIIKNLDTYNETIDGATFVFQVEATKTDADANETKPVYSNVVAIDFNAPGKKEVIIQDIPAGADVTVTEIYTGASYTLTSDAVKTKVIIADEEEGALVRRLVEEIRSKKYYLPELELLMVNEEDEVIGYVMFSRFHIEGKYEDELLILTPAAVKTELQRQHISKELIEYGFLKAKELGYKAVIVEGNPQNYRNRGFDSSYKYGVEAAPSVGLPHPDCLMIKELEDGALEHISGLLDYSFYECLK